MTGQLLFTARFVVQWLRSEKEKKSVIPKAFWYLSIGGGLVLLAYAVHKKDPVFILGQFSGLFIYLRNIQLIRKEKKNILLAQSTAEPDSCQVIKMRKAA